MLRKYLPVVGHADAKQCAAVPSHAYEKAARGADSAAGLIPKPMLRDQTASGSSEQYEDDGKPELPMPHRPLPRLPRGAAVLPNGNVPKLSRVVEDWKHGA